MADTGQLLDTLWRITSPTSGFSGITRSIKIICGQTTFRGLGELEAWNP